MSDRQIVHLVVGPVQTNCYLVMNQKTKETIIVDPGAEADKAGGHSLNPWTF